MLPGAIQIDLDDPEIPVGRGQAALGVRRLLDCEGRCATFASKGLVVDVLSKSLPCLSVGRGLKPPRAQVAPVLIPVTEGVVGWDKEPGWAAAAGEADTPPLPRVEGHGLRGDNGPPSQVLGPAHAIGRSFDLAHLEACRVGPARSAAVGSQGKQDSVFIKVLDVAVLGADSEFFLL